MQKAVIHPRLVRLFGTFLEDFNRAAFVHQVAELYTEPTLIRLLCAGDRYARRAAGLALSSLGTVAAETALLRALSDEDRGVRWVAEDALQSIWSRAAGIGPSLKLKKIQRLNFGRQFDRAADEAEALVNQHPDFAEAWFQLGTACLGVGDFSRARVFFEECLRLQPAHFHAAQRLARVLIVLGEPSRAAQRLRATLQVHPGLEPARTQLERLRRSDLGSEH